MQNSIILILTLLTFGTIAASEQERPVLSPRSLTPVPPHPTPVSTAADIPSPAFGLVPGTPSIFSSSLASTPSGTPNPTASPVPSTPIRLLEAMTPEERELEEASRRARRQRHRDIQEAAREEALAESRRRVEAELAALANIGRRGRNFVNSLGNNDNVTPTTATPANRGRRGRNLANRPLSNNNNN